MTVTPEMIFYGASILRSSPGHSFTDEEIVTDVYEGMRALDPEVERLRLLLSYAQTYVKLAAENGNSAIAAELFFDIKSALSQTQSQAQDQPKAPALKGDI